MAAITNYTNKNPLIDDIVIKKTEKTQWKNPLPFKKQLTEKAPSLIECLSPITKSHHRLSKIRLEPISLIASSALANVSLACQGLANVSRYSQLISPASMYFLLVASSGERKSAIDNAFSYAAITWEPKIKSKIEHLVVLFHPIEKGLTSEWISIHTLCKQVC